MTANLTKRAATLLTVLTEHYIAKAQPVASRTLANDSRINLSSASVRNIMAELTQQGYLVSPHTSAGRIPTAQAYRYYAKAIIDSEKQNLNWLQQFDCQLHLNMGTQALLESAANLVANITKCAGFVTSPKRNRYLLKHIEFLPLSTSRVLVLFVINEKQVENRIIDVTQDYNAQELRRASTLINNCYTGQELTNIKNQLHSSNLMGRSDLRDMLSAALQAVTDVFPEKDVFCQNIIITGQDNLLNMTQTGKLQQLRTMFNAFSHKHSILQLLDKCLNSKKVQIYIGTELDVDLFGDYSLVAAPYFEQQQCVGTLGVIGPMHLPYDKAIHAVNITTKLLSTALNQPT
jgi:heat-inducible transcriptional repressor